MGHVDPFTISSFEALRVRSRRKARASAGTRIVDPEGVRLDGDPKDLEPLLSREERTALYQDHYRELYDSLDGATLSLDDDE